jgi:Prenyltransferase and squalene oxidase repeat
MSSGGWSFFGRTQASIESTCLAAIVLSPDRSRISDSAIHFISSRQNHDGGWPSFEGDKESSWTTALAMIALTMANDVSDARDRGLKWLLTEKGEEGHWLWRWKFKTADRNVRFDPDKYGWPWSHGAGSWVVPTAFSVIAIKQYTVCDRRDVAEARIRLGVEMLLDRACVDGGWNSGNSVVYGVPLRPHVEATAVALLALQDERRNEVVDKSLLWLRQRAATVGSASSLAWTILSLFTYREPIQQLQDRLANIIGDGAGIRNNATLALVLLALRCGEMIHPFMVFR